MHAGSLYRISKIISNIIKLYATMSSHTLQDQMTKAYIESVFNKYDADYNGYLDIQEMTHFFNDLFHNLGIKLVITEAQSLQAIKSIDQNNDGLVDRKELFNAFKLKFSNSNPQRQQNSQEPKQYGNSLQSNQGYNQRGYSNQFNNQGYNAQGYGSIAQEYPANNPYYNGYGQGQSYSPNTACNAQKGNKQQHNTYQQGQNPHQQDSNASQQNSNPHQQGHNLYQ